jgi:hypothetical protein
MITFLESLDNIKINQIKLFSSLPHPCYSIEFYKLSFTKLATIQAPQNE